jgi:hypothetical protein
VEPSPHVQEHWPPLQVLLGSPPDLMRHFVPQEPQSLLSVWRSTHAVVHRVCPLGQGQFAALPPGQADPSAHLQVEGQLAVFFPSGQAEPSAQAQLQAPFKHVLVASPVALTHLWRQEPQLLGSLFRSMQPEPQFCWPAMGHGQLVVVAPGHTLPSLHLQLHFPAEQLLDL